MAVVISVHEYLLKPGVQASDFERAVGAFIHAKQLKLPGLIDYYFVRGIRGQRKGRYAMIWVYESRRAWEALWGAPNEPRGKDQYPQIWRQWESRILAPFLDRDPDQITYTAYQEVS